jgi:hypothetical protein
MGSPILRLLVVTAVLLRSASAVTATVAHILLESKTQAEFTIEELGKVGGLRPPNAHLETIGFEELAKQRSICPSGEPDPAVYYENTPLTPSALVYMCMCS